MHRTSRAESAHSHGSILTAVSSSMEDVDLQAHMRKMINRLTVRVYRSVSVALFADHQLTFSFMLCTAILRYTRTLHLRLPPGHAIT